MKNHLISAVLGAFMLVAGLQIVAPQQVSAGTPSGECEVGTFLGLPTWYKYLELGEQDGDPCAIIGPEGDEGGLDMRAVVGRVALAITEILLRLAAVISVGFVMYGGFRYIISQGEPDSAKVARQTILNALIGLVISIIATGLVFFIASTLT